MPLGFVYENCVALTLVELSIYPDQTGLKFRVLPTSASKILE